MRSEILERVRVEEALRAQVALVGEAEERFRTLIESSPSGICVTNGRGEIILVNRAVEDLFGYRREELIGKSVDMLTPERHQEAHVAQREGYMAHPTRRPMGAGRDLFGRHKDGSEVAVEIGLCPLTLKGDDVVLASIVDITERRRERAELARYAAKLEVTNAELEKFAYVVSHDIKAPLRGISSVATWIAEDFGSVVDEESRENLELLLERTTRLSRLIDGILAYSRAGRGGQSMTSVATGALVSDVISSVETPVGMSIRLVGEFPTVTYNETQLRQVFQNLLDNAITHMDRSEGEIVISCEASNGSWTFFVRDNGVGIPERHFVRIFELFQTLRPKDEVGTTGAGLAITKRIVESNGGEIRVSSTEGKGAVFSFTVPRSRPAVEMEESESRV